MRCGPAVSDESASVNILETDGLIAAAFDHRTSRAGDPLLHTHVVVANMTRVDAATGRCGGRSPAHGLFEHAKAAGHLYQAHLRHLLSHGLGVRVGSGRPTGTRTSRGCPAR